MEQKNILVFMSDQHAPKMSSYLGGLARTPTLENMAERGMSFDAAYTACPLCVPARMAFLSGRLPSRTGILNNFTVLPDTTPTIAHAFSAAGYETVLVGRMHFVGEDQRHGFHHRLVGDIRCWKSCGAPSSSALMNWAAPKSLAVAAPRCRTTTSRYSSPLWTGSPVPTKSPNL